MNRIRNLNHVIVNGIGWFCRDRSGNVAMMFGLALVPMLGAIGTAIDYSRASDTKSALQSALDSTVLAVTPQSRKLSDAQLQALGLTHFNAIIRERPELAGAPLTLTRTNNAITASSTVRTRLSFMQILGAVMPEVTALAQASTIQRKAEVAMVLDNTGSMSRLSKMDELKKATVNFLNAAEAVAPMGSGLMKVSLVPFDTQVKVDPNPYRFQNWLTFQETAADSSFDPIRSRMALRLLWQGCIENRGTGYEASEQAANSSVPNSLFPAVTCKAASLAPVQTLTDNWTTLRATANAMTPSGNTDLTIGARFGLATLSSSGPIGGGAAAGTPDLFKYMIILTDGTNTEDRYNNVPAGIGSEAAINAKASQMCSVIKSSAIAPKIKIFTVRMMEGNQALLSTCASSPGAYYEVTTASQVDGVFKDILKEITQIKLTM